MALDCWYRFPGLQASSLTRQHSKIANRLSIASELSINSELCFYIQTTTDLTPEETDIIKWILSVPFENSTLSKQTKFTEPKDNCSLIVEIGPRLNFSTAFSTNVVSMCHTVGLKNISRVECSVRYLISIEKKPLESGDGPTFSKEDEAVIVECLHDKMTHCRYIKPIQSFDLDVTTDRVYEVDVMNLGKKALQQANANLGLAFDDWDIDYYTNLFKQKVQRNPTSVECFDLAQSNSEHSRHWFFKGRMVIDGVEKEDSLFQMVMDTQKSSNQNNIIKFNDNSSAIDGFNVKVLCPQKVTESSQFAEKDNIKRHLIFTAETHNFPTGVAPFPGATTGTGGRIRDVQATGRGAHVIAGTAGYSFGNLNIPGYDLEWEDKTFKYPPNFALPVDVAIEASNGASDYGNKFGEPVLTGFARSFGLEISSGDRREWVKPIMFSGGIGAMEAIHADKMKPEKGMEVVKIGGPVYRIGVGGGAASSIQIQGDNEAHLDFGAVQRGDAEMEQKMNRVLRSCIEMGERNPVCSIHDQGAGGNGNVLKEISEPSGAVINAGAFQLADPTLSIMEIWGAEYQESNAALIQPEDKLTLMKLGVREKCPVDFVGTITDTGKIQLLDDIKRTQENEEPAAKQQKLEYPVDLDLELVLGSIPRKKFDLKHQKVKLPQLSLPENVTVREALHRVLRLPSVASKRYLTNKVDRAVTGLVAQQQCVGPLHTPLADVAVVALSHFDTVGGATAIGEQPIKGLVDAGCGARMTVGEALTNLVAAQITSLKDVKCSGNWMWAAKLPGEGALLYDACTAMCEVMKTLGVAVDGGKDSLSMAARVGDNTVKAPGTLVVSTYVGCPDITATLTPDIKCPNNKSSLVWVRFGSVNGARLGGTALAQCYKQLGDTSPDMDDPEMFVRAFNTTQKLSRDKMLLSCHDISDGGLVTCVLEMAFAGNCGLNIHIKTQNSTDSVSVLFAEELGVVVEVDLDHVEQVCEAYKEVHVPCLVIGKTYRDEVQNCKITVKVNDAEVLNEPMTVLRDEWEETSFQLERLQTNPVCVEQEKTGLSQRKSPPFNMTFDPESYIQGLQDNCKQLSCKPRVAVLREEGSNGDREMVSAFHMAGFEVWDVNTHDMCSGQVTLDMFRGIVFVGGFSYADAMGSAKGWAAVLKFNKNVKSQLTSFYQRTDTFSLGVCNGCQLMALLGWVGTETQKDLEQGVHLSHNTSERFESRFVSVEIQSTPSIMLQGMEGSVLGIWVQHGEGKFVFKTTDHQSSLMSEKQVPLQYVDDNGVPTEMYPHNPNGSPQGIAGLCSADGRHLAMMPHPERCVLPWQWAWKPHSWRDMRVSPWLAMFYNAYNWCVHPQ